MWSGGAQRAQERKEEGRGCRGPWGTGPSSRVPLSHPRPYSGARESRGRRVTGELAPAPGYTEEISLSLSLSACEPPPGPLPIPGLASCFSLSLPAEPAPSPSPWAPGLSPEGWQGSVLFPRLSSCPSSCPALEMASFCLQQPCASEPFSGGGGRALSEDRGPCPPTSGPGSSGAGVAWVLPGPLPSHPRSLPSRPGNLCLTLLPAPAPDPFSSPGFPCQIS